MTLEELQEDLLKEREGKTVNLEEMWMSFAAQAKAQGFTQAETAFLKEAAHVKGVKVPAENPNDKPFSFQAIEDQYQKEKREGIQDVEQFISLLEEGQALNLRIAELEKARNELLMRQERRVEVNRLLATYLKHRDLDTPGNTGWDHRMTYFLFNMYEKMKKHIKESL